jgi:hypothetical protein
MVAFVQIAVLNSLQNLIHISAHFQENSKNTCSATNVTVTRAGVGWSVMGDVIPLGKCPAR